MSVIFDASDTSVQLLPDMRGIVINVVHGIDVAVQLWYPDHGESSGVVRQLISVGKKPLITRGTSESDLGNLAVEVSHSIKPGELASIIVSAGGDAADPLLIERLSRSEFAKALLPPFLRADHVPTAVVRLTIQAGCDRQRKGSDDTAPAVAFGSQVILIMLHRLNAQCPCAANATGGEP